MGEWTSDGDEARVRDLERRLAESERRLDESQALARIGSWEWDLSKLESTWSRELLRMFGREAAGAPPGLEDLVALVYADDREEFAAFVARARATPGPFTQRYRILDADGQIHYLYAKGRTISDESGKPVRAYGTTQDITELTRTENDLRLRVAQQAGIAALGRSALTAEDPQALMDEAVEMVSRVLGVELVELLELDKAKGTFKVRAAWGSMGRGLSEEVPDEGSQMREAMQAGVTIVGDYGSDDRFTSVEFLRRHGCRSGITAGIHGADHAYGVIGAHSTEPRRFSREDAHFVQAVGNVIGAAVEREQSEVIKAQLAQSQRLESLGQLAGGIAHDFNNLLLVILSHTELLIASEEREGSVEGLKEIERAAESAADLTKRLLLFSRRERAERSGVDVGEAVRATQAMLRRTIGEHIELQLDAEPDLPTVNLAAGELDQVLVNLVVNARDALPNGGSVAVAVKLLSAEEVANESIHGLEVGPKYVCLSVADGGEGMSEEEVVQAFDPFFTTKPRGQGTGLGLATVYGIVGQAGGTVEIDSAPGRGTTVSVYLPATGTAKPPSRMAQVPAGTQRAGRTVLVVDNERAVRVIVAHMLEKHDYRVCKAADAAAAERILDDEGAKVDLLLTDVLMPGVSGRELVERIRARRPGLAAIYMSGYSGDAASPLGPWNDGVSVLEKPFTSAQLIQAVDEALA
jgi:PAS domain S-box-containing protein